MKILLVIDSLHGGGAERVMAQLGTGLAKHHEVHLAITRHLHEGRYPISDAVQVHQIEVPEPRNKYLGRISSIKRVRELRRLKRELGVECSISFLTQPNYENIRSCIGERTIISIRNCQSVNLKMASLPKRTYLGMLCRWAQRGADHIVCVSDAAARDHVEHFGADPARITVIHNPCNAADIAADAAKPTGNEAFERFASDARPLFANMGRVVRQKGQWHLLRAFAKCLDELPDAKLVVLGMGNLDTHIRQLAETLGIKDRVMFTGFVEHPHRYLAHSDAFVFPSTFEGFSNALLESLACGLPVIAADYPGGAREVLAPGTGPAQSAVDVEYAQYGIITPALSNETVLDARPLDDAEEALVEAMLKLAGDEEMRRHYAQKSAERIGDFAVDRFLEAWEDVIAGC